MTLTQVLYALEVARCRNFSKAAEQLFLSQPALSLQIKKLEDELGYSLFSRTPHGVFLTDAGQNFYACARPVADSWSLFRQKVQTQELHRPQLRIGMGSRAYSNGLFQDIFHFYENHTDLEVTFVAETEQNFLSGLRNGMLDLALSRMPSDSLVQKRELFSITSLIWERQCVLMSWNDPHSSLRRISFQDLQNSTLITGPENSIGYQTLRENCKIHGITLQRIYHSSDIGTGMCLVRNGSGIAVGPESFAQYFGVCAVPLEPIQQIPINFICLSKNADRPKIQMLCRHLQKVCQKRSIHRQDCPA